MKIRRIGNYLNINEQGYLVNRSNVQNNQSHWLSTIEAVKDIYLKTWADDIHSIYVRGSIAKGIALDNVSDIDSFAVLKADHIKLTDILDSPKFEIWTKESEEKLQAQFPFITGLEIVLQSFESIKLRDNIYSFIIKVESTCIYGDNLATQIAPYKLSHEMAFQTQYIHFHLEQFWSEYPNEIEEEKKLWLNWLMRRFLRLGMEFVMQDEQRYTRDLYLCYESFAKHYPNQAEQMYHALELAINPQTNEQAITFVQDFGNWLVNEADKKLRHWGYKQNEERHWFIAT
ncbi:MAG: hypothetical protein ACRC2S_02680 [Waterburya sp.]